MKNPRFNSLLHRITAIHDRKNHDYANDSDPYSNFNYAARVMEPFIHDIDRVFAGELGKKMSRIAELRKGKTPQNESLQDSYIDLATYACIWASMFVELMDLPVPVIHSIPFPGQHKIITNIKEPDIANRTRNRHSRKNTNRRGRQSNRTGRRRTRNKT